jgi:hypothetical protein
MTTSTDRQQYREVLASLVQKTQARFPDLNGRLAKATRLALMQDVELHADGTATVHSASDPTRHYRIVEGTCTCRDWEQAPEHLCQHRLAAGLVRKARELVPQAPPVETAVVATAALPEAPASANCHIMLEGRQVQLTLRDTDETRLLQRLAAVLQQYPVSAPPATQGPTQDEGWCQKHGVPMTQTTKNGRSWFSHRTAEGTWCKGR